MTGIHISGTHSFYHGGRDNPKKIRWWAENGLIHCCDQTTGVQSSMSRRTFLQRLQAVSETVGKCRADNVGFMSPDEQHRTLCFIENGLALAREAQRQGDPDDPRVAAEKFERRASKVFIPADNEIFLA